MSKFGGGRADQNFWTSDSLPEGQAVKLTFSALCFGKICSGGCVNFFYFGMVPFGSTFTFQQHFQDVPDTHQVPVTKLNYIFFKTPSACRRCNQSSFEWLQSKAGVTWEERMMMLHHQNHQDVIQDWQPR